MDNGLMMEIMGEHLEMANRRVVLLEAKIKHLHNLADLWNSTHYAYSDFSGMYVYDWLASVLDTQENKK